MELKIPLLAEYGVLQPQQKLCAETLFLVHMSTLSLSLCIDKVIAVGFSAETNIRCHHQLHETIMKT